MATKPEPTNDIKVDPNALYLEEIFTDRRVGTIRRMTPVKKDGNKDTARAVIYQGETQVLTPAGALPIGFDIPAVTLEEAADKFGQLAREAIERQGKLHALITQNIDELHQLAGNSPERVVEVHGSMRRFMCWGCGMRGPMQLVLERVRAGEADPPCRDCGGILKSDTISFGQQLVPEVIDRAMQSAGEADVFIAVGTSLQVYTIAGAF